MSDSPINPEKTLASNWRKSTWGDEISLEYGKAIRDYAVDKGKYRVFGTNGPVGWTDKFLAPGPGVILGRKGAYRGVKYSSDPFWVIDTAYYVKPKADLDIRWLYYAIQHYKLGEIDDGSPIPSTTRSAVYVKPLLVPPKQEQTRVSSILGMLDDKIALNQRMSTTLEELAQALFKSWFIDFDPVHAKAEGRPTNLPKEIDVVFPDSFEDSPMGLIPAGWQASTLSQLVELNPSRSLKKGQLAKYLDMANVRTAGFSVDQVIEREFGSGTKMMNGDTLLARITPCLENGKTAFVDFLEDGEVGWGSTEFIVMKPKEPLPAEFGYCLARDEVFREFAIQSMTGSSGRQRVQAEAVGRFQIAEPTQPVLYRFTEIVRGLFLRITACESDSKALATLRSELLPGLITGNLTIRSECEEHHNITATSQDQP